MKTMKVALLATAALAAFSVSARADDAAAIKAQLEALTARIAQLEAAPAAPIGYSLLTISEGPATVIPGLPERDKNISKNATIIGILPAADAPASTTVEWSGYVRAALVWNEDGDTVENDFGDDIDVLARANIQVVGKTDTAVGEVGVKVVLRAEFDGDIGIGQAYYWSNSEDYVSSNRMFKSPEAWGWWAMTPELTLGGGYAGSLGNSSYDLDSSCTCAYQYTTVIGAGDTTQLRLSYGSGPFSMAIALEDGSFIDTTWTPSGPYTNTALGVAANIKYSGDTFGAEITGVVREKDELTEDMWNVSAGVGFSLADMLTLHLAGGLGSGYAANDDYWKATATAIMSVSDAVRLEAGVGFTSNEGPNNNNVVYLAGAYWEPVTQLSIGLEGSVSDTQGAPSSAAAAIVTRYNF